MGHKKYKCNKCNKKKKSHKIYECENCYTVICRKCINTNCDTLWECRKCETLYNLKELSYILKPSDFLKLWIYINGYDFALTYTHAKKETCKKCRKHWSRMHIC